MPNSLNMYFTEEGREHSVGGNDCATLAICTVDTQIESIIIYVGLFTVVIMYLWCLITC